MWNHRKHKEEAPMSTLLEPVFNALRTVPRLLIEADLYPVQGDRFQPTGFPDLGAAIYRRPDSTPMLLVESPQSMANRLEAVCWDDAENRIITPLGSLPHIVVELGNGLITSSIQEAHRLNSPYIINDDTLKKAITSEIGDADSGPLDIRKLAHAVFQRDVGAVVHGVFLEKVAGRLRLQRLLSSFIEAENVIPVTSGGVKLDRVDPQGNTQQGYGNVPFSRTEFVASRITAYCKLDLATMRGYGLGEAANRLLITLALYKFLKVLDSGLRLRTDCDLEVRSLKVTRPAGMPLNEALLAELEQALPSLITACGFSPASVVRIKGQIAPRRRARDTRSNESSDDHPEEGDDA
jgi:CRISPR-associated protein Csb1